MQAKRIGLLLLCVCGALVFGALGVWQIERRAWKLDLIARVESRVHSAPVAAPPRAGWTAIFAQQDEYRRVRVTGQYLNRRTVLVDALTELGPGYWVLAPLKTTDGVILINRGFVPPEHKSDYARPKGLVTVVGLLRATEPGGRFLRPNKPSANQWYSRDVEAISTSRGLSDVAPFFVDAEKAGGEEYPIGGMTVVRFRNVHLVYAITWFLLAGLSLTGVWLLIRPGNGLR